jgi:hypothetical protein
MRRFASMLLVSALLVGCGQTAPATRPAPAPDFSSVVAARASAAPVPSEVSEALTRVAKYEKRLVKARHVALNDGKGAAELYVRLSAADRSLLLQCYRLHPRPLDPAEFPAGLVDRAYEHLTTLHRFKFPDATPLDPARLRAEMRTRCYRDGDGNIMAFESYLTGDNYMAFGKYDLKGRILKVDIETWVN